MIIVDESRLPAHTDWLKKHFYLIATQMIIGALSSLIEMGVNHKICHSIEHLF